MNNGEKQKKDPLQTGGALQRQIDKLANESLPLLGKSWVFIARTRVKTWQGLFMLAFVSGAFVSFVWSVSLEIESLSKASGQATLSMDSPQATSGVINVTQDETFDVELLVDTGGVDAVAVRAMVTYNQADFQLTGWDTSGSIFATGNTCVYQGNPCQIIDDDAANGKISLTLAKPSPGVNSHSGLVATLTFKALRNVTSAQINYSFEGANNTTDSDVIEDDGTGNDLLNSTSGIRVSVGAPTCTSYTYSDWGTCQSNGTQTRTATGDPAGCSGGVDPEETIRTCTYVPPTCSDYNYSAWGVCQSDRTQTRTVLSGIPEGCDVNGGAIPVLSQECYNPDNPPECTSYTYGEWGTCQTNGTQTRTVTSSIPDRCSGGAVPQTFQLCTNTPLPCTRYEYSEWGECQPDNMESRTVISGIPAGCTGGEMPITIGSCMYSGTGENCTDYEFSEWGACQLDNYQSRTVTGVPASCTSSNPPDSVQRCVYSGQGNVCTNFTYSDWGKCTKGKQTRSIVSSSPSGCAGGSPEITRSCGKRKVKIQGESYDFSNSEKILTSEKTISFSGTDTELAGGTVEIYREGKLKTSEKVGSDGKWSLRVKEKKNGTYEYRVRYVNASGAEIEKSSEYRVKIDTEDPEITDLPLFFMIGRGEKLWWDAKDNDEIDHYRYVFLGKSKSTKSKSFNVPADAPTGIHTFQLIAYDEAGNRTVRRILVRVR